MDNVLNENILSLIKGEKGDGMPDGGTAGQFMRKTENGTEWADFYEVGDYIMSDNETSPAQKYGGSWEKITDRFLVGAGGSYPLGSTGGSTEHSHSAGGLVASIELGSEGAFIVGVPNPNNIYTYKLNIPDVYGEYGSFPQTNGAQVNGNTETANNTPPYIAVNIWRRVA